MDQNFTRVGFNPIDFNPVGFNPDDLKICPPDVSCHELQMDSTAFVYHGSLYMISLAKRLYFVNRKGLELLRELSFHNLKRDERIDFGTFSEGIIMVDSDDLIFCSRLLLVGCRTTKNFFDDVEEFRYPKMSYEHGRMRINSIGFSNKSILVFDENENSIFSRKQHNWIERKISNSKYGQIVTLKNFTDESDLVLLIARDRSCDSRWQSNREYVATDSGCMKFDIYYLRETDGILKWKKMGIFGKPTNALANDEGTMFFPKIIRKSKNDLFPFGPEIHLVNYRYDHQNGSQILFENWTKNMSRDIDDNFPITVTNRITRLRILQI